MAPRRIFPDKTELIFMLPTKSSVSRRSLTAGEIVRIQFDKVHRRILGIFPQESESITVVSGKFSSPLVFKKHENKKFFDAYKQELQTFAKNNNITFTDNTK